MAKAHSSQIKLNTKVLGQKTREMVKATNDTRMAAFTTVNGKMTSEKVKAS